MMKLIWAWQCLSKDRHLRASALAMASYSRMIGTFGEAKERRHRSANAAPPISGLDRAIECYRALCSMVQSCVMNYVSLMPDWRPRHIRAIMHILDEVSYDQLNSCSGASKV